MTAKSMHVKVIDKMTTATTKGQTYFYLIVECADVNCGEAGYKFDFISSPTRYSQTTIGDEIVLELRPFDVKQTGLDNLLYFSIPVFLMAVLTTVLLGWIVSFLNDDKSEENK